MANGTETEIDKLGIDISVKENDAAAKITAVADAVAKLRTQLASLTDVSKQMNKLTQMFSSLKIPNTKDAGVGQLKQPILKKIDVNEETGEVNKLSLANSTEIVNKNYEMATSQAEYNEELRKTKDLQNDNSKNINKSAGAFSKLTKSIGRIAFYRAIRTALKEIVQAAKEGLANISAVNPEFNKTMNNLSQSFTALKNSFGSLLAPIIQMIQPFITQISDSIARIVNKLNEAQAVLKGETEYSKILTSDTKEYQEQLEKASKTQGKLLSFDTFTTQQASNNEYTGMKREDVTMDSSEATETLSFFTSLQEVLSLVFETLGSIWDLVKSIIEVIKPFLPTIIDIIKSIIQQISGAIEFISGILKLLTGDFEGAWKSIGKGFAKLVNGIANMFIGLVNFTIDMINVLIKPISWIVELLGGGKVEIPHWEAKANWQPFASGGNYQTGDYFVANENGKTELVASSNSGGGSVMNLDQWASISYSSFYRALSDYNAAQNGRGGELDINSLGRTIAGNTGFVNEMNRRNTSLNLI